MTQIALATLEALIGLELMALASISKYKATVYKTWSSLATKYQHLASDTCTENDSQFVLDLPSLPEKVIDGEYDFDLDDEQPLSNGDSINLDYDDCLKDQPINGYQVAQWLVIFFYVWLQSVFVSCLDFLDRVIEVAHNTRYILIYHVTNDVFVYLDIGETT